MGTPSNTRLIKVNSRGAFQQEVAITTSDGAADVDKIPALNADGLLDPSFLPTPSEGFLLVADEDLFAGALVNVFDALGSFRVRLADATAEGKEAHGFVLADVVAPDEALVRFTGRNTATEDLSPGYQYLTTVPGRCGPGAPKGSGRVLQIVGVAVGLNVLSFEPGLPITRA